jgi:Ion channel
MAQPGATVGYGDITPKTDMGKIAVALYAIASVQAVAILLEPGRVFFEGLCRVPAKQHYDNKGNKAD